MARVHIFQRTAEECACDDEEMVYEYMHKHEFRLASMCNQVREKMLDAMIAENGIEGGWFWHDTREVSPIGPFTSWALAKADAVKTLGHLTLA